MSSGLSEFISVIKQRSIARTNRYRVNFNIPVGVSRYTGLPVGKQLSLTCLMADIPSVQNTTDVVEYGNYQRNVSSGRIVGDFVTTFLVTGLYDEKKFFDTWYHTINDEAQNAVEFYDDYISNITVECLNSKDEVTYTFELTEAYPLGISALKLDRTAQNQQMVLDVTWSYHKIITEASRLAQANSKKRSASRKRTPSGDSSIVPGFGSGKNRIFEVPGIDQMSDAVKQASATIKGVREQIGGVLEVARDVREQVRDFKMETVDAVRVLTGVVKDVKAVTNIPNEVKQEVIDVVNHTKNEIGGFKREIKNFKTFPRR